MKFLADFFPVLLFFIAYKFYGIYAATAVAMAASLLQVTYHGLRYRHVPTMHWVTLGLLLVMGGMTLILQDKAFIMWKPTVVNWLFAIAFLATSWLGERTLIERMMSHAIQVPRPIWRRLNLSWAVFFLCVGAVNLVIATDYFHAEAQYKAATQLDTIDLTQCASQATPQAQQLCETAQAKETLWVNFKLFGILGLTLAFVLLQAFYLARHALEPEPSPDAADSHVSESPVRHAAD